MKVLIVEDDPATRKVLCAVLAKREGYEPVAVASAEEAQILYQQTLFPLVILDLNLPNMNGLDFSRWLRQQPTGDLTYILMGTANAVNANGVNQLNEILEAGADDYIGKPYHPSLMGVRLAVAEKQIAHLELRKRLAQALKRETDFVSAVIETTTVLIVVLDVHLNIIRTNPAFKNLADPNTNYSLDLQRELLAPEIFIEVLADLQGKTKMEKPISFITEMMTASEEKRYISWTVSVVPPDTSTEAKLICSGIDITERQDAQEQLAFLALRDPLTHCYNRNYLLQALQATREQIAAGASSAMLSIDLDNFKIVNDSAGHLAGDRLLINIVRLFREGIVSGDDIIRLGGDEFIIILNGVRIEEAQLVAERIRQRVDEFVFVDAGKHFNVGVSIGIAMIDPALTPEQIISRADSACYVAKAHGRNCVKIYDASQSQSQQLQSDINWRDVIRKALREDGFELWHQPVVEISTGQTSFNEVLLRLKGEDGNLIPPNRFLPAAERLRIMPQIDRHVMARMAEHLASHPDLRISINLSAQSLGEPDLAAFILETFPAETMAPRVCFEITETAVISDIQGARQILRQLNEAGFGFALDDFGVGFSSFDYLKNLPIKYLKIDGSFIVDMVAQPVNRAFIKAMSQIAHDLGIQTVAECVETAEILEALRELKIDFAQGFYTGRPAPCGS